MECVYIVICDYSNERNIEKVFYLERQAKEYCEKMREIHPFCAYWYDEYEIV